MASLASAIGDSDLDEDLALAAALQMSLADSGAGASGAAREAAPGASQRGEPANPGGGVADLEDQLLQQALNASLGIDAAYQGSLSVPSASDGQGSAASGAGAPIPSRSVQLLSQNDASQEELMMGIERAKAKASKSAKKRRKSAKKLARRNRRSNSGAGVGDIIISNTVEKMDDDELRSELRRLAVPFPWPPDHDGLAELLKTVVSARANNKKSNGKSSTAATRNGDPSPIRPKKNRGRRRKQRKFMPSGDLVAPSASAEANSGLEHASSDDLILKQVLASSLRDTQGCSAADSVGSKGGRPGGFHLPTKSLHNTLAMREQMELERALEENAEEYERQQVFASLDSEVRIEAERIWKQSLSEFRERGGTRPTTDFVISLARDTVSRKVEEAKAVEESINLAAEAEKLRAAEALSVAEATLIKERNSEDRRARAARFAAAAFDRRQRLAKSDSNSKKATPG